MQIKVTSNIANRLMVLQAPYAVTVLAARAPIAAPCEGLRQLSKTFTR